MNRIGLAGRPTAAALVASAVVALAWGLPHAGLGQGVPGSGGAKIGDLLKGPPFDRIVLTDGTVLNVEPVTPRPLPVVDPKAERERKRKQEQEAKQGPPREGNIEINAPNPKAKKKAAPKKKVEEEPPAAEVTIHVLDEADLRDFKVARANIRKVDYFEDMILAEAHRLAMARDFNRAFEHLMAVQARDPKWKGLDEAVNDLLFREGSFALLDNDTDRGLRLLRELYRRKPDYPELADKLAESYTGRIGRAFDVGAYQRGRQILHELETIIGEHPAVKKSRSRFVTRAQGLADRAGRASDPAERLDALAEALRIWPALEGAAGPFAEAFAALPTLDVAVADLTKVGPWARSPAGERVAPLLYVPILADTTEAASQGTLPGQLAATVVKGELGRRLEIQLRPDVPWSDGTRPVGAIDVVRALSDRTDPRSPAYDARWADLLQSVRATEDFKAEVRLTRPVIRPEAWLLGPVGPAHAAWDGWVTTPEGRRPVGDGPFRYDSGSEDRATYRAGAGSSGGPKVRRLVEHRYPNDGAALAALIRGDVTLIEHVPAHRAPGLAQAEGLRLGRFEQPTLHAIAVDGRTPALRNRTLRRGLSYAIDRRTLLEENLLKRPGDDVNTPADGPSPRGSYADAQGVKPLEYRLALARMLVAAAVKEMGGQKVRLTFEYPATLEAQAVAPRIADAFRDAGLEIKLVERPADELEEALRSGRTFDLAYRAVRPTDPITGVGPLLCPGYDAPPSTDALASVASPRILQLLLQMEHAPDLPTATGLATLIDREARDELPILPLWQLQDHYAWRTRLTGPAETAARLYQGIDAWEIEPWFAKDPW